MLLLPYPRVCRKREVCLQKCCYSLLTFDQSFKRQFYFNAVSHKRLQFRTTLLLVTQRDGPGVYFLHECMQWDSGEFPPDHSTETNVRSSGTIKCNFKRCNAKNVTLKKTKQNLSALPQIVYVSTFHPHELIPKKQKWTPQQTPFCFVEPGRAIWTRLQACSWVWMCPWGVPTRTDQTGPPPGTVWCPWHARSWPWAVDQELPLCSNLEDWCNTRI